MQSLPSKIGGDEMPDGTVDNLNLQLSADADQAARSLDKLVTSLKSINTAFTKDISGMRKFSKEIGTMASAIRTLNGVKVSNSSITSLSRFINSVGKIKTNGADEVANDVGRIVSSFKELSNAKFNDTGINKVVNSLNRLFKADFGKFNPNDFQKITQSIGSISNIPDVSSNVNRLVSSLSRLANAGEKTGQSANDILRLGQQTREAVQELSGIGKISDDVNQFVSSIAKLSSSGNKTGQTASGLGKLAGETLKFFQTMEKAPKISENTIRMTQALAQLASSGGRVNSATNSVVSAFNRLSSIGGKTLTSIKKLASGIVSAFRQIGSSGKQVDSARFSLVNLLKTAVGFQLGYGLLSFVKQSFELGSSITEVENVVDVAFGSMASKAYEFASTATEQFGLSELAAKQYAGTMMAMLNSTGVAQDAAAEMSTTLAGLAGDLASFYNISTDDAFMKLRSAIAGETEPMRQLGVNMTVAALQSYALSQGITKSWQSMTQAEQAMLRYNYIMSATAQQQGDYQRTINSFANQWRLLTLNVQQFSATVGQGIIAAVLPAVQALNALMSVLQRAAEAFRNFMYVLTGYEGGGSQGGIVNEFAGIGDVSTGLEDIGSSGGDAADGMDDASSAAKKLKKSLSVLSFDQLHQLSDAADDAADALGNASGAGGGLDDINVPGSGIGGLGNISDAISKSELPKAINEWAKRIRTAFLAGDWEGLGAEIAWGLNKGLQKIYDAINWENVGPKITAFTTAFTETFNSLVNNFDWELLGRTIGAGINTIVNSLNQLADGIDWLKLGKQISDGFNGLFDEVDWNNLGHLIGNKFRIAWDLFGGFVKNLKFDQIGTSVAEGLNSAFSTISFGDIADYLATALNGAFTSLASFAETFKWDDLVDNISNGIITFIESFEWEENGQRLNAFLTNLLGALKRLAEKIPWEELGQKIGEFISEIDWPTILYDVGTIIAEALGGIFTGLEESGTAGKILSWLIKVFAAIKVASPVLGLVNKISKFLTGSSSKGILSYAFDGLFSKSTEGATKGLGGLSGALGKVKDFLPKLADSAIWTAGIMDTFKWSLNESKKAANFDDYTELSSAMLQLKDSGLVTSEQFDDMYGVFVEAQNSAKPVEDAIELLKQKLEECGVSSEVFQSAIDGSLDELKDTVPGKSSAIGSGISQGISDGVNASKETTKKSITDSIGEAFDSLKSVFEGLGSWFSEQWNKISGVFSKAPDDFKKWFSDAYENVQYAWFSVGNWFSGKWDSIKKVFTSAPATFKNWFQTAYTNVKNVWNSVNSWFSGKWSAIKSVFSPVATTFKKWFQSAYNNVTNVWQSVNSWFSGKWSSIKTVFSPVANTFKGWFQNAYTNVKNVWNSVNTWFSGKWSAVKNVFSDVTSFFKNGFQSAYNVVTNIFRGLGSFFKNVANNAFSPIKSLVNGIISGANWVLRKLGSKTRLGSWGGVNFAKGSNGLERDTLGIVNDQKGSTYKELIVPPNGKPFIPKGRNVMLPLQKGTKIMPAKQTKELMKSMGIRHFAGGIGKISLSDILGDIPFLARGGIITAPTLALTGENFRKEAVLPLENRRSMQMIANSIVENSDGLGLTHEELAQTVAEGVAMAMMNNSGNQPNITVYAELKTESDEVLARAVTRGQNKLDYRKNPTAQFGY